MIESSPLWADPRLVYGVAVTAIALLFATIWLFRRRKRSGRQAAIVCLIASIALHVALVLLVPLLPSFGGGDTSAIEATETVGVDRIAFSTFDPEMQFENVSGENSSAMMSPLPVSELHELVEDSFVEPEKPVEASLDELPPVEVVTPDSLASIVTEPGPVETPNFESELSDWLSETSSDVPPDHALASVKLAAQPTALAPVQQDVFNHVSDDNTAPTAAVVGDLQADFANRVGSAKQQALLMTGGSPDTEAAVELALRFLASGQRADGAWDPQASGAGQERAPLGMSRGGAGSRAETAITGLAILSLVGAGNTHQQGEYAENVYRGLAYLIRNQKPDGSLAGNASVYESTYSHGMAALAICEAAAITKDSSALEAAARAVAYTTRMQHPSTGGWRYTAGDPGDLSQLGWQAMVIDGGRRAGLPIEAKTVSGIERFVASVRAGTEGGLACYRAGEAPSRTMTAEALATRLLIGMPTSTGQIAEAERSLLQQLPGTGQDNYYYWYYATLALHQLQDDAWRTWNEALKQRLLATQRSDGSWPTDSVWGGYGGAIYTTSMATLCLESYYRHAVRDSSR